MHAAAKCAVCIENSLEDYFYYCARATYEQTVTRLLCFYFSFIFIIEQYDQLITIAFDNE